MLLVFREFLREFANRHITSKQRCYDVFLVFLTSYQRPYNVVLTLYTGWVANTKYKEINVTVIV